MNTLHFIIDIVGSIVVAQIAIILFIIIMGYAMVGFDEIVRKIQGR